MKMCLDEMNRLEEIQENICWSICKHYDSVVSRGLEDPAPCRECPLNKLDRFAENLLDRRSAPGIAMKTDSVGGITAEGDIRVETWPITLDNLQEAVGGYIETVPFAFGSTSYLMVVNEEGKLMNLPDNLLATKLRANRRKVVDPIVGSVVILMQSGDELVGLSRADILYLMDYDRIMEVFLS